MTKDQFKFDYYLKILRFNLINKITSFGYSFPKIEKNINIKNSIEKQGFYKIDNYLSDKSCEKIVNLIDEKILDNTIKHYISDDEGSDRRFYGFEKLDNLDVKRFNTDSNLINIGENILKTQIKNCYTMASRLKFQKNNLGSGGGWHRDSIHKSYKALIYLTDVNLNNGPFQIIPSSSQLSKILKIDNKNYCKLRYENSEINEYLKKNGENLKTIIGQAGTMILFDGSNLHRGSPIEDGLRYSLTNYYFPKRIINRERNKVKEFLIN